MKKIQLLDCTLRDGAYITDAKFGQNAITGIIGELSESKIDIIEIGWLKNSEYIEGTTFFHTPDNAAPYLQHKNPSITYVVMIDWDRYNLDYLTPYDGKSFDAIRVVFPREKYREAMQLAKPIREKGYRVFFQAANTLGYTDENLVDMIRAINEVNPEALSIVDTFGAMYEEDLTRIVLMVNHILNKNIRIGLHSHNNLQQSFSLSMAFTKLLMGTDREIILDGSLVGMGRGAGNAPTELIAGYLNRYCNKDYDMNVIMDTIDLYMTSFIAEYEWGYSIPFFLSGTYCAHVNNIAYLKKSHRTSNANIKGILESMPTDKRLVYDYDMLEQKYVEYKNTEADDTDAIRILRESLEGQAVYLIAPGANATLENEELNRIRTDPSCIKIGINAIVDGYEYDFLFFSNSMRYKYACEVYGALVRNTKVILTSNIHRDQTLNESMTYVVDFNGLARRGWIHFDNSMILCLRLLDKLHIHTALMIGFDGYSEKKAYADGLLKSDIDIAEINKLNQEIQEMFIDFRRSHPDMELKFVTPSIFHKE